MRGPSKYICFYGGGRDRANVTCITSEAYFFMVARPHATCIITILLVPPAVLLMLACNNYRGNRREMTTNGVTAVQLTPPLTHPLRRERLLLRML